VAKEYITKLYNILLNIY